MSLHKFLQQAKDNGKELARLRKLVAKPKRLKKADRRRLARYPSLFRNVCQSLALARHRDYSTRVVSQLNHDALESHQRMYGSPRNLWAGSVRFITHDFPCAFRAEPWLAFWSFAMFFATTVIIAIMVQWHPELAYSILGSDQIHQMEAMYANDTGAVQVERYADSDVLMFGVYISNNIGIAFYTFAGGVLFGLGSCFFLLFNGVVIGAVAGHLHRIGVGENLYTFGVGHGSFELTAIAIAGMAGLVLGRSLLAPGRYSRVDSLRRAARQSLTLIGGAAGMLVLAAFVEAFWSPRVLAAELKYSVGAVLWLAVGAYLAFSGRSWRGS